MSFYFPTASNGSHISSAAGDISNSLSYPYTIVMWLKAKEQYVYPFAWHTTDNATKSELLIGTLAGGIQMRHEVAATYKHVNLYNSGGFPTEAWTPLVFIVRNALQFDFISGGERVNSVMDSWAEVDVLADKANLIMSFGLSESASAGMTDHARVAEFAVFNREISAGELANIATNRPDNLGGAAPEFYREFRSDYTNGLGAATFTDTNSDILYDVDHPNLTAPVSVDPVFTAGPTVTNLGETTVSVTGTSDENCTAQVVIVASGAGQPTDGTFDGTAFTATATATAQFSVDVTGLTGLTNYDAWVRLKPTLGTSAYSSVAFSTTPAAPTLTSFDVEPLVEGSTVTVTGSGLTGHTSASINGTAQTAFTVVNDTTVTFTAVNSNLKFGDAITVNIGGTTLASTMSVKSGFSTVDIINPLADKAERFDVGQTWDIADGDQVGYDNKGGTLEILPDGTLVLATGYTLPDTLLVSVFDSSDNTWGAEGSIDLVADTDVEIPVITLNGNASIVWVQGNAWIDPQATVTDNMDAVRQINADNAPNVNLAGAYVLSYNATDAAGNAATQVTRTVTVSGADATPNQFTFVDVSNAELNTTYTNTQSIVGVDVGQTLTATNGTLSNDNGVTWSSSVQFVSGQTLVRASITTDGTNSQANTVTVTVNGISDDFIVTTRAAVTRTFTIGSSDAVVDSVGANLTYTFPIWELWDKIPEDETAVKVDSGVNFPVSNGVGSIQTSSAQLATNYIFIARDSGNTPANYIRTVGQVQ